MKPYIQIFEENRISGRELIFSSTRFRWLHYLRTTSLACALLLASGCGGGGGGVIPPTSNLPALPTLQANHAVNAPIIYDGGRINIGANVAPPNDALEPAGYHESVRVSHGRVNDGVGANVLIEYLSEDARSNAKPIFPMGFLYRFGDPPPTVRVAEGATREMISETVRAVQIINAALPQDWQLKFSHEPGPAGTYTRGTRLGEILVEFAARKDWSHPESPTDDEVIGFATWWSIGDPTISAQVWVDHTRASGALRLEVLVHEMIHTLFHSGHADENMYPDSIMVAKLQNPGKNVYVLSPFDREALLAVYSRIRPGANPAEIAQDLGPWTATSIHVRGDFTALGATVSFGTKLSNGIIQPWALGPAPAINLENNQQLFGSATWSGRLLGFTSRRQAVGGAADLTVQLATLTGDLGFTELEFWIAGQAPGSIGSGSVWGDGDLNYQIDINGNTFSRTGTRNVGDDDGEVTGAFFGRSHQAMGGVLRREDIAAGFGGER